MIERKISCFSQVVSKSVIGVSESLLLASLLSSDVQQMNSSTSLASSQDIGILDKLKHSYRHLNETVVLDCSLLLSKFHTCCNVQREEAGS
jgi:hypothetical protein